jgi:hypothetical protein
MKLLQLLTATAIIAALAAMLGPRLAAAKRYVHSTLHRVYNQHNERIDYLSSGCLEDPTGHHTTERDVDDSTRYFTTLDLR